jgi:hypothetical protein
VVRHRDRRVHPLMSYHQFMADDGTEYGSFEVFAVSPMPDVRRSIVAEEFNITEPGWYWWACYPGCLPDGEAIGPFDTEADAIADARSK